MDDLLVVKTYIEGKHDTLSPDEQVDLLIQIAEQAGIVNSLRNKLIERSKSHAE